MLTNAQKLGIILHEIQSRVSRTMSKQASAEKKLPQVLQTLVVHGRITPEQKQAAAALLRDPDTMYDFVMALARHQSPVDVKGTLGVAVPNVKQASKQVVGAPTIDWDERDGGQFRNRILAIRG